jgi:hypothetical protein
MDTVEQVQKTTPSQKNAEERCRVPYLFLIPQLRRSPSPWCLSAGGYRGR